jgi:DNA (cytosine-5)-methyltransferase 1
MAAYYNEHDPFAAQWLRNLIEAGHIAPGTVDERSIEDVTPADLMGYTQCHFFAGIGVWSYALRKAGWPDDRPVWTGSCPCQPFSSAGKGLGVADERHLWPAWFHLIQRARTAGIPILGEQVANGDGLTWLDLVQADLEGAGFAFGALDLCAAGFAAPHIRQRLFFYASEGDALGIAFGEGLEGQPRYEHDGNEPGRICSTESGSVAQASSACGMANTGHGEHQQRDGLRYPSESDERAEGSDEGGCEGRDLQAWQWSRNDLAIRSTVSAVVGYWDNAEWIPCRSPKVPGAIDWRPIEPGTFPLADGAPGHVGRLRAYGNAINAEVAKEFIIAVMPQLIKAA